MKILSKIKTEKNNSMNKRDNQFKIKKKNKEVYVTKHNPHSKYINATNK